MSLHVNNGGSWVQVKALNVNHGGTWTPVKKAFVNQGGTWHEYFSASNIPDGCYGYYEFDELDGNGYTLNNISGNNDGTTTQAISTAGMFGQCLAAISTFAEGSFRDYVNGTVDTPTVALWANLDYTTDGDFSIAEMSGQYGPAYAVKTIGDDLIFEVWDFQQEHYSINIPSEDFSGVTFLCIVESPVGDVDLKVTLYLNDVQYVIIPENNLNRSTGTPVFHFSTGLTIDQVTLYSTNLTHEEILSLYNDGNGIEG